MDQLFDKKYPAGSEPLFMKTSYASGMTGKLLVLATPLVLLLLGCCLGYDVWQGPSGQPEQMRSQVDYDPKLAGPFFEEEEWSYPHGGLVVVDAMGPKGKKPSRLKHTANCFLTSFGGRDHQVSTLSLMSSTQAAQSGPAPIPFYKEVAAVGGYLDWDYGFLAKILFITVAIEYLVVYLLLGRPTKARIQLLFYIVLVNVVTEPAEQFAIVFLADPDLLGSTALSLLVLCLIELVVVIIEFGCMRSIFRRMYVHGVLHESVSSGRTFVATLTANVAGFAIGNIGFLMLMAAMSQ